MRLHLFQSWGIGFAALCVAAAAPAQTVTAVTDFQSAPGNGVYSFPSSTPATVMDLLQSSRPRPAATARAELVLPPNMAADAKLPAVVLVHGSGGIYPEEVSFWARRFNERGIAAFVIDVFGPRGVKSTGEDQGLVPYGADTADAFAALGVLATHPRIDAKRIANGSATSSARFAAHLMMYSGGCAGQLAVTAKPGVFGPAPMLFVHGDADDYTYLSDCRAYAQRIAAAGTPTEVVVLPGARHKFDVDDPKRVFARNNPKTKEGCPLEFDVVEVTMRDRRSGEALTTDKAQVLGRELCADKGATLEGNRDAREAAGQAALDFLAKVFKL